MTGTLKAGKLYDYKERRSRDDGANTEGSIHVFFKSMHRQRNNENCSDHKIHSLSKECAKRREEAIR